VAIEKENKTLILLDSLPDEEYETFVLTLINDKQSPSYSDVPAAHVNHEVRRTDKQFSSSSTTTEAMTARGMGSNHQKGKGDFEKSKTGGREDLKKNQCNFCKEEGHWKIDCAKLKPKKESKSEANIA